MELAVDMAIRSIKAHRDLQEFLVGDQRLFADPAALRVEVTSIAALVMVNPLMEHTLVVSPKLGPMLVGGHSQETWTKRITDMRRRDPECAITRIAWRKNHHQGNIWALPEALPAQTRADRIEEGRHRRPNGANAYLAELVTINVVGSMGPCPAQLLDSFRAQIHTALGRTLHPGSTDRALLPGQYLEERNGDGCWNGVLVLRLSNTVEAAHICQMLHGASVEVGQSLSTVTAFNPRFDATNSRQPRSGGRRGGRR